ncbi:MAG: response regulator [Planctomycetales bacterium]|nr:response regulator [Planctomycetales bacterium]
MNKHVLIADDDDDLVDLLTRRMEALGLTCDSANNAMTALGKAEESLPDLMILDVEMPCGDGLSVCEMMAGHEELKSIPVVIITGNASQETVQRCYKMCAYYVPKCPDLWSRVGPLVTKLTGVASTADEVMTCRQGDDPPEQPTPEASAQRGVVDTLFAVLGAETGACLHEENEPDQCRDAPWVLSVEDDDDVALALKIRLQELGVRVERVAAGVDGFRQAYRRPPQAILLDYELPQGNGDYVLRRLKETPDTRDIPVIVLTGRKEAYIERQVRSLGAAEFLTKPFDWARLREALLQRIEAKQPSGPVAV